MKNLGLIVIALVMGINGVVAQQVIPLWEGQVPGNIAHEVAEERTISEWGGAKILTGVSVPELWAYKSELLGALPAVIICPGGGYRVEAYEHEGTVVAEWLNTLGIHAFVLKYRLPDARICTNATEAPLMDLQRAMQVVREHAGEWHIAKDQIGVMGFSAGGHLAASASNLFAKLLVDDVKSEVVRPDFSILMYPVISMEEGLTHPGSKEALLGEAPDADQVRLFSMEQQVTKQTPPTFILHAWDDEAVSVNNTIIYTQALEEQGVSVKQVILTEGGHGFGFNPDSPTFSWTQALKDWLEINVLK